MIIRSSGDEAFTTYRLDPHYTYRVHVSGTVRVREAGLFSGGVSRVADAEFVTANGNFTDRRGCLAFSTGAALGAEDRATHVYSYDLYGNGEKLSVRFRDTEMGLYPESGEFFRVAIERADEAPSKAPVYGLYGMAALAVGLVIFKLAEWRRRRAEERAEALRRRDEERKRKATEWAEQKLRDAKRALEEKRERRFREIHLRYSSQTNYDDPDYVRHLALRDRRTIVSRKAQILKDHVALHDDPLLVVLLQRRTPEIYRRLTIDLELLRIAERAEVFGEPHNLSRFEAMSLYGDDSFVDEYARANVSYLCANRDRIVAEHERLHADPDFVRRLKERPEIYKRATWEIRALELAERLRLVRPHPGKSQSSTETEEDLRRRKVRQQESQDEDKLAQAEVRIRSMLRAKQIADTYPLDENEKAAAEQMLRDALDGRADNGTPGRIE